MRLFWLFSALIICSFTSCDKEELGDLKNNPHETLVNPHIEVISVREISCDKINMVVRVLDENIPDSISYTSVRYEDPFGRSFWTVRTSVELDAKCNEPSTYLLSIYNRFNNTEAKRMEYTYTP